MNHLNMWTIYKSPSDAPGKYVIRRWEAHRDGPVATSDSHICNSLEEARSKIPTHELVVTPRHEDDDACIVETWF